MGHLMISEVPNQNNNVKSVDTTDVVELTLYHYFLSLRMPQGHEALGLLVNWCFLRLLMAYILIFKMFYWPQYFKEN